MLRWFWLGTSVTWMRRGWCRWIVAGCWQNSWVSHEDVTSSTITEKRLSQGGKEQSTSSPVSSSHTWLRSQIRARRLPLFQRLTPLLFPGFEFFETSAKDNINVKQTFERLVDLICDKMSESLDSDPAVTTGAPTAKLTDSAPPLQQPGCNC